MILQKNKRKAAIILAGGIGDNLLFIPMLKWLKKKSFTITLIYYKNVGNDCIFDTSLFDKKIYINNKLDFAQVILTHIKYFTITYCNHIAQGKLIRLMRKLISKKVTTFHPIKNSKQKKVRLITVNPLFTDGELNNHLIFSASNSKINHIANYYFNRANVEKNETNKFDFSLPYYIIQLSAGNNETPFKNWSIQNWSILLNQLSLNYKHISFVLLGDKNELQYGKQIDKLNATNINNLIGKTSLQQTSTIIANSKGYIGLDSGLMHLAVALQKKTYTIFGGSNENLYGYQNLDSQMHKVIASSINCRPCSSWHSANVSRVPNPLLCPDFACLKEIKPEVVYLEIINHFKMI